jgi:hypothetical protein
LPAGIGFFFFNKLIFNINLVLKIRRYSKFGIFLVTTNNLKLCVMRKFTLLIMKNRAIALAALLLTSVSSYSNVYVATTSGNWSSATTWNGTAPSFNITADQITISAGVTVTLDGDLSINGTLASLNVLGSLTSADTASLYLNMGAITGTGNMQLGSLTLDSSSLLAFTGPISVKNFTTSSAGLQLADSIAVSYTATIAGGTLTLITGGVLTLDDNATIDMAGGTITISGGLLNLSLAYNLVYTNSSATTGAEAGSSFLNNVTIDVPGNSTVTLGSNLVVQGTLNLQQGYLSLNNYNLDIVGNVAASGSGNIMGASGSSITFSSTSPPAGALIFAANANTINDLIVNVGGFGSTVQIGSNLTINGGLQFVQGSLDIGDFTLTIATVDSITGAGTSSYIITGDSGALAMSLTAGQGFATYPIGTASHYNPALIQLDSGSASGMVMVGTANGVDAAGTSGTDLSLTQPMVDATWFISSNISSNLNLNMQLAWPASTETNHFNIDSCYVSHYTSNRWDTSAFTSAASYYNSYYILERDSITSLSPFAVFGTGNASAGIEPVVQDLQFDVYPNPAGDNLTINTNATGGKINMEIINVDGQVVASYVLTGPTSNIELNNIESGNYLVKIYNNQGVAVKQFVKL